MLNINRILVAYDFSPCADEALRVAYRYAARYKADLHVLFALLLHEDAYGLVSYPEGHSDAMAAQLEEMVEKHAEMVEEDTVEITHAIVRDVAAGPAILRYAEEHNMDLVVMGTHGRRGLRRMLLGSVAEEVVRMAKCPVLTVHQAINDEARTPMIIVPVDFSKHAMQSLSYAKHLAARKNYRVHLLHIVEETFHPAFYQSDAVSVFGVQPELESMAQQHMEQMFAEAPGPYVDVTYEVRTGNAASEICAIADHEKASLIVMATHGLSGFEHFLMGSVAEKVVRMAATPVFCIKAFGKSLLTPSTMNYRHQPTL